MVCPGLPEWSVELRIRRLRKRERSWLAVLAGGVGLYAVLAVGFHWFVEPGILTRRASLPTETLMAYGYQSSEEPATSGHALRGATPISVKKSEPPRPADGLATAKAEQGDIKELDIRVPKKEPHRNMTRQANDRLVQRSSERRGPSWSFSSSPASPNYR